MWKGLQRADLSWSVADLVAKGLIRAVPVIKAAAVEGEVRTVRSKRGQLESSGPNNARELESKVDLSIPLAFLLCIPCLHIHPNQLRLTLAELTSLGSKSKPLSVDKIDCHRDRK
jgi:hypothetical protein